MYGNPAIFGVANVIREPPGLVIGGDLIVADLHLGYAVGGYKYSMSARLKILNAELNHILKPLVRLGGLMDRLIILGDVKEPIGYPTRIVAGSIGTFLRRVLDCYGRVLIVRGNHDGGLRELANDLGLDVRIVDSLVIKYGGEKILLAHGHMKVPLPMLHNASIVVLAHIHPVDIFGRRSWIVAKFLLDMDRLVDGVSPHEKKLIVVPHANPYMLGKEVGSREEILTLVRKIVPRVVSVVDTKLCISLTGEFESVDIL